MPALWVSAYNFLSADPFGNFSGARELGVLIEGGPMPKLLWNVHVGNADSAKMCGQR